MEEEEEYEEMLERMKKNPFDNELLVMLLSISSQEFTFKSVDDSYRKLQLTSKLLGEHSKHISEVIRQFESVNSRSMEHQKKRKKPYSSLHNMTISEKQIFIEECLKIHEKLSKIGNDSEFLEICQDIHLNCQISVSIEVPEVRPIEPSSSAATIGKTTTPNTLEWNQLLIPTSPNPMIL